MTVEIEIQKPRTRLEIAQNVRRKRYKEKIENVASITKDSTYVTFHYTDGTSYSIAKDYLDGYKIL